MNRILMATAAALVLGAPLAFAANSKLPNPAALTTEHCSYLETPSQVRGAMNYSAAAKQTAEEKAMSLCRQDRHEKDHPAKMDVAPRLILPLRS